MDEGSMLRPVSTTAEPLVRTVSVVYLYVSDMERSLGFYRDLLGIPLEGDGDWQEATLGGTRFALHKAREGIGELSSGTIHVSLEVADVDAAAERLRGAGVSAKETMRDDWGAAVQVVDPDGYEIYLFQPPR
jgi:lactoylglutathione lyase